MKCVTWFKLVRKQFDSYMSKNILQMVNKTGLFFSVKSGNKSMRFNIALSSENSLSK